MIGERIKQARRIEGLSLRELGARVGVSHQAISKYEKGADMPSPGVLMKLSAALGVGMDNLLQPIEVSLSPPAFRKHSRLGKKQQDAIIARVEDWIARNIAAERLLASEERVSFRQPRGFPRKVSTLDEVEEAAAALRDAWRLGLAPIQNLTETLEEHGVLVGVVDAGPHFDALTLWANETMPVIAVRADLPFERLRFNLAHELGHLAMDCAGAPTRTSERLAHRFAGAFLVPASVARHELGAARRQISSAELGALKKRYGLGMLEWLFRARDLGIIGEGSFRSMRNTFNSNGWTEKEPVECAGEEKPARLMRITLRALAEDAISYRKAQELCPEAAKQAGPPPEPESRRHAPDARELLRMPQGGAYEDSGGSRARGPSRLCRAPGMDGLRGAWRGGPV